MKIPRRMLIALLGAVLVAVLFFMFVLKPKIAEIAETKEEVAAAEAEAGDLRSQIAKLEAVRDHAPELRARLNAVATYLPSTAALPNFIRQIQRVATNAGVDLQSIAPSPPAAIAETTGIQQINVTLVVRGGFFRMQDLLARIENMPRIVQVSSISVAPSVDDVTGGISLQSTLALKMYVVQSNASVGASTSARSSPSPSATRSP